MAPVAPVRVASVTKDNCVGCGACMKACTRNAVTVWMGSFSAVNEAACIGCGRCVRVCPRGCIKLKEVEK